MPVAALQGPVREKVSKAQVQSDEAPPCDQLLAESISASLQEDLAYMGIYLSDNV